MKNTLTSGIAMMAISLSGCNSVAVKTHSFQGRLIEFKSGPEGFDTRTFFYEGEHEVVAFDSQFTPDLAKQSILHLRKYTRKPITWLVITHPNPDKFNGTSVFKAEGSQIISSAKTADAIPKVHEYKKYFFVEIAKMFKDEEYPPLAKIDETFREEMTLVLKGGEKIMLRELSNPGVSTNQTVAFIPSIKSLIVGDLVHHKAHAWLEGGIRDGQAIPTIEGWIQDLNEVLSLYPESTQVFGGRGITVDLKSAADEQVRYLRTAQDIINEEINRLETKASEFAGPNAGALYKDLAAKFQTRFPDYSLPYMIEYGAYGLVLQSLSAKK